MHAEKKYSLILYTVCARDSRKTALRHSALLDYPAFTLTQDPMNHRSREIVVDGYNLLHALYHPEPSTPFEPFRRKLEQRLLHFQTAHNRPVTLQTPSLHRSSMWRRNIDLLSIVYAFRPRLRYRLTLGGFTFPRKP